LGKQVGTLLLKGKIFVPNRCNGGGGVCAGAEGSGRRQHHRLMELAVNGGNPRQTLIYLLTAVGVFLLVLLPPLGKTLGSGSKYL
jgi:hypothetical protein